VVRDSEGSKAALYQAAQALAPCRARSHRHNRGQREPFTQAGRRCVTAL